MLVWDILVSINTAPRMKDTIDNFRKTILASQKLFHSIIQQKDFSQVENSLLVFEQQTLLASFRTLTVKIHGATGFDEKLEPKSQEFVLWDFQSLCNSCQKTW